MKRRQFLFTAAGLGASVLLGRKKRIFGLAGSRRAELPVRRKLIVILFGGGTRSRETIDDPEHKYIPRLWKELVPRGTLFTNVRVEHKVVHPNATGSIMTGHWEWDDIDWSRPVAHPTIFEIYRKARRAPDTSAWAFVYASILAKTGESLAEGYGSDYAANVAIPPTIPRSTVTEMGRLFREAASLGDPAAEARAAEASARLARSTSRLATDGLRSEDALAFLKREYGRWKEASGTTSHDSFLADCAISCMKTFAPNVISIDYGEIDCAHYGSRSRYVDAIRRTDALAWKVWKAANELPAYRGNTLVLILPDHGRELEESGGSGFVHHSDFYTGTGVDEGCRRVWMLALGPGVAGGRRISNPIPITAAAATGLEFLELEASRGAAISVLAQAK